ncbi:MAG: hypothetical protein NVS3B26_13000 [Mycobacteriales bacterium]
MLGVVPLALPAGAAGGDPSVLGRFSAPFEQPGAKCVKDKANRSICKPAGASVAVLPNGKIVYWDALEGMEDVRYNVVAEYGGTAQNDLARVLDLRGAKPTWTASDPNPVSNPHGNDNEYLPGVPHNNDAKTNDGDLFCSDQVFLADGRVLDVGGTSYYLEAGLPGQRFGASELEGLKLSRLYNPASNTWSRGGAMKYGRWYPSLVTLPNGGVFVASGVTKLIKPVYPNRPQDSGTNVLQTETYSPRTGTWSYNGDSAKKSLPLFPRLHLLPDGHVYYDAAGQTFNPDGQSYDEALWNMASSYDPAKKSWTDLGMPKLGPVLQGFRGSAFSQMLTLKPDAKGDYPAAQFLSAGGVFGVSPGTYLATDTTTLNTVTVDGKGGETFASENVGALKTPRWYPTGVTLPTGEVLVFNGASRDEVVNPGSAEPIMTPEMYNPDTKSWTKLADQSHGRTYHNTAVLLPDGRVLVGGHAPIGTGYAFQTDAGHKAAGLSNPYRDPSFELFSPPNLFYGPRPVITAANPSVTRGKTLTISTPDAADIATVTIVRNTAITHLVDGDQRVVELPIMKRGRNSVTVDVTGNAAVLPDGPYNLFLNRRYAKGLTPSVGRQVFVGAVPAAFARDVAQPGVAPAAAAAAPATAARAAAQATSAQSGQPASGRVAATEPLAPLPATRLAADWRRFAPSLPLSSGLAVLAVGGLLLRRRRRA